MLALAHSNGLAGLLDSIAMLRINSQTALDGPVLLLKWDDTGGFGFADCGRRGCRCAAWESEIVIAKSNHDIFGNRKALVFIYNI